MSYAPTQYFNIGRTAEKHSAWLERELEIREHKGVLELRKLKLEQEEKKQNNLNKLVEIIKQHTHQNYKGSLQKKELQP